MSTKLPFLDIAIKSGRAYICALGVPKLPRDASNPVSFGRGHCNHSLFLPIVPLILWQILLFDNLISVPNWSSHLRATWENYNNLLQEAKPEDLACVSNVTFLYGPHTACRTYMCVCDCNKSRERLERHFRFDRHHCFSRIAFFKARSDGDGICCGHVTDRPAGTPALCRNWNWTWSIERAWTSSAIKHWQ